MRHSLPARSQWLYFGALVLAGIGALMLCLSATASQRSGAVATRVLAQHPVGSATIGSLTSAADATTLAANATGGLPAGGVLGDVTGLGDTTGAGVGDILAIDQAGNLWLYPNTGSGDANMFADGRSQVGQGWTGYSLAAVADLYGAADNFLAGIVAIDPAGNLWYYPNTGGTGLGTFGARSEIGVGWTGYTVVGVTGLDHSGNLGIVAIDPAGNLWYYPGTGMTGMSTFAAGRTQIGSGWIGYTADVEDINGSGNPDIVAVDSNGNLWLYPNAGPSPTSGVGPSMFGAPSQIGSGWSGYQAVDLGFLSTASNSASEADILAIDPAGNLWYYPNTGTSTFGAPIQVGSGWTGYRVN